MIIGPRAPADKPKPIINRIRKKVVGYNCNKAKLNIPMKLNR